MWLLKVDITESRNHFNRTLMISQSVDLDGPFNTD